MGEDGRYKNENFIIKSYLFEKVMGKINLNKMILKIFTFLIMRILSDRLR